MAQAPQSRNDRRAAATTDQTPQERRAAQMVIEQSRLAKEAKDAIEHRKKLLEQESVRRGDEDALAKSLKPLCQWQTLVEPRLSSKTTSQLGAAIQVMALKPKTMVRWVTISKERARDCLGRAYPLALQMGQMAVMDDRLCALKFPNGSLLEFTWPTK